MLQSFEHLSLEQRDSGRAPSTVPISYQHSIGRTARLADALDLFQSNPQMRMLPVIDADQRPTGAIFEQDMRLILFNPFGHALLKNPS